MNATRHDYRADVLWQRAAHEAYTDQRDSRRHRAHQECFIANSVKTDVRCEPRNGT